MRRHRAGGAAHFVELYDSDTNELFGMCPLQDDPQAAARSFQVATDSSRCFVIRVEQQNEFAYIGLNFAEKLDALKFCRAVLERNKHVSLLNGELVGAVEHSDASTQPQEFRAEGRIVVDLHGKFVAPVSSGASSSQNVGQPLSLQTLPKTGATRRIHESATCSGAVMPPTHTVSKPQFASQAACATTAPALSPSTDMDHWLAPQKSNVPTQPATDVLDALFR